MNLEALDTKIRRLQKLREILADQDTLELLSDPETMQILREFS